jgi:3-hydroxybutyryl-CoA dehydratase
VSLRGAALLTARHAQTPMGTPLTLLPGDYAELSRTYTAEDVKAFAAVTGDDNPVHLDLAGAAKSVFRRPVAHGILTASLISAVFGTHIPGSVYVRQSLHFRSPVYVGDTVSARVTVSSVNFSRRLVKCTTVVTNAASNTVVLDGEAVVLVPNLEVDGDVPADASGKQQQAGKREAGEGADDAEAELGGAAPTGAVAAESRDGSAKP